MRSLGTPGPWIAFDRRPYKMHAGVDAIRVNIIASRILAHGADDCPRRALVLLMICVSRVRSVVRKISKSYYPYHGAV